MIRKIHPITATVTCVLLAGCLGGFQGDRHQIDGEKLGPGHCRQPGIIEISIQSFNGPPNATLAFGIHNLKPETLNGIEALRILGNRVDNALGYSHNYQVYEGDWKTPQRSGWLYAHENTTIVYQLPDFPDAPWKEIQLDYNQGGKDPIVTPSTLHCSLVGDNAPWAFASKT